MNTRLFLAITLTAAFAGIYQIIHPLIALAIQVAAVTLDYLVSGRIDDDEENARSEADDE